jgi:DNA repair protein RadC
MTDIKKLPAAERPRERLKKYGAEALSIIELVAIILSTGTHKCSVLNLAGQIVTHFGTLQNLIQASVEELMEIQGIGLAKAVKLKAALGLAHKAALESHAILSPLGSEELYQMIRLELSSLTQEALFVALKDVKGRLISVEKVSIGTLSEVLVHPREVFFPAVRHKASSIILAHNHPSGDPTPSTADIEMTRHLIKSSHIMGIYLEDHLIIGKGAYVSLRQKGYFG